MDKRPSVLIVGMGYGHIYLHEMMNRDTGADLVGVCDTDPHVAEKQPLLAEHNIPVYRDLQSFYAERRPSHISTPILTFLLLSNVNNNSLPKGTSSPSTSTYTHSLNPGVNCLLS